MRYLDSSPKFFLAAIHNGITTLFGTSINITHDSLPLIFMSHIVAITEQLSERLKILGSNADQSSSDHTRDLIKLVNLHLRIVKAKREFTDLFSSIILIQGLLITLIMCVNIYMLSFVSFSGNLLFQRSNFGPFQASVSDDLSWILFLISLDISMALHFLFPCYFGQLVQDTYDDLNASLYDSNWINQSESFKKLIRIMMENLKKPEKVSAFGVFTVDLENFKTAMNSAFSLYAVLKSMN